MYMYDYTFVYIISEYVALLAYNQINIKIVRAYTYLLAVNVFLSADLSTVTRYCPIHVELIIVGQKLLHVRAVDGVERVSVSGECLTDRQRCAPSRLSQIRDDVNETVLLISTSSTMYATRPVFVESLHGLIAQKTSQLLCAQFLHIFPTKVVIEDWY